MSIFSNRLWYIKSADLPKVNIRGLVNLGRPRFASVVPLDHGPNVVIHIDLSQSLTVLTGTRGIIVIL